ncbi:MAG TPA: MlaD family protein [Verrucomicrobiae bacterium]|jgi:phospholipid/cholesterol/gamma-HCH transport system substrate-binding protein|nr:MlaD family protein [Verrucomicrobiae bacterium]
MSQSRLELKVGAFVVMCLVLLAALLLQFSKGNTLFRKTYQITLDAENVAGLRADAAVLMSGVKVGTVMKTELSPQGTNVLIHVKIYGQYIIRDDARFAVESAGFLGDQYVAVYPELSQGKPLTNGSTVYVEAPFNLQEAAKSANGFIKRMDETAKKLDGAISDVRRLVLNETTLTNLSFTVGTLKQVSVDALTTVDNINQLIRTNGQPVNLAVSNLVLFSHHLNDVALQIHGIVDTNRAQISQALSNINTSTDMLTNILGSVQAGQGLAGTVLKNQEVADNVSSIVSNLAVTTGNLNRLGLWHFIWYHPKAADEDKQLKFAPAPPRQP